MTASTPGRSAEAGWFTASYSNQGNMCVQVRFLGGQVQIADSKDGGRGPVITVTGPDWDAFVATALGRPANPGAALTGTATDDGGQLVTAADGTTLRYTAAEWAAFLAGAADGEFRRPRAA
jgi:hypothetical protein